jgi:leucyl-tRNA synthetase
MVTRYGADTTRLYVLFAAPPEKEFEWSEQGIEGAHRFLHRLFRIIAKHAPALRDVKTDPPSTLAGERVSARERQLLRRAHQTIRRVSRDFAGRWHFNTSIAAIMELVNELYAAEPLDQGIAPGVLKHVMEIPAILISPFAPHLGEELWEMLGHPGGLVSVSWPKHDAELAQEEQFEVVIQINGRLRGKILVSGDLGEDELVERALSDPRISRIMEGKRPVKTIVVPNKLVNMVLA